MTSPVNTSVKFFTSDMSSAPILNGVAGSMIGILDACLVNGFGMKSLTGLVVASGIATATFSGGASAAKIGSVVLIEGSTPASLNGEQKVLSANSTTVTFATGEVDGAATGTITMKMAPAGWLKSFSSTNTAAYKSADVAGTGCLLRVDDTGTTAARVVGYQTMSDIATGTGPFPTAAQVSGGDYWIKSSAANSVANNWYLVTDGRMFYFGRAFRSGNNAAPLEYELHAFGDFLSVKSNDPYGCIISGNSTNVSGSAITGNGNYWHNRYDASEGLYAARSYSTIGGSVAMGKMGSPLNGHVVGCSGTHANGTPFPNPADGGFYVTQHNLFEAASSTNEVHRGTSPGFYTTPHYMPNGVFAPGDTVVGVNGLPGRTLQLWPCQNGVNGLIGFDITGPWR